MQILISGGNCHVWRKPAKAQVERIHANRRSASDSLGYIYKEQEYSHDDYMLLEKDSAIVFVASRNIKAGYDCTHT